MGKPTSNSPRIALLWRGDWRTPPPAPQETRHKLLFEAFTAQGACAEAVHYDDAHAAEIRAYLSAYDGVLVWVDPLSEGRTRETLDPLLRDLARAGVWVSAHPDTILKMGVKEVLHRTRDLGWGADTHLYRTEAALRAEFPARLATQGPRVLKPNRGNGGQGVWKVCVANGGGVRVLSAERGSMPETLALSAFLDRIAPHFGMPNGCVIDQPYQPRLPEGMVRCYVSQSAVAGYGHQLIKALVEPPLEGPEPPGPRIMYPPDAAPFQRLRRLMEEQWIPEMQRVLEIETRALPVLWDADFLYGPKTSAGEDTYVLCEINVSSVAPYPDSAPALVAAAALRAVRGS